MGRKILAAAFVLAAAVLLALGAQAETTTTVLMYMCGSDIQSDCVTDMGEMCSVALPDSVHVVVQAGGALEWDDSRLTPEALNRFTIENQDLSDVEVLPMASMGAQETLYDFLTWAVPLYPADRYVLVLWDHGGGSADGVCFDKAANDDGLTIHEVNDALYDYQQENAGFRLDVVGFDACLMATYEMAAHMSGYADYMVASEELEPALGWNYAGWLSALAENPDMDSQSLSVAIADAYLQACLDYNPDDYYSQSVVYLPAMDGLVADMEEYAAYLIQALQNGQLAAISRERERMYAFGTFADSSTDMVDFMNFLDATRQFAPNTAAKVDAAYARAVRYTVGTDKFEYLTGLSILMPYATAQELGQDFSGYSCGERIPNYSQYVEGCVTMLCGGDYQFTAQAPSQLDSETASSVVFSGNMNSTVFVPQGTFVADESASAAAAGGEGETDVTASLPEVQSALEGTSGAFVGALTPADAAQTQPSASGGTGFLSGLAASQTLTAPEDGSSVYAYSMTLTADELANLSMVEGLLYIDGSDGEDTFYIELGAMQNAGVNWTTGDIASEFDGKWPMLADQVVVIYDQVVTANLRRSAIRAKLNGEDGFLLVTFNAAHPDGVIVGFTKGYDETGIPVRGSRKLQAGDVIVPTYPVLYDDGKNEDLQQTSIDGEPITVGDAALSLSFEPLKGTDTNYLYCFRMTDIYGDSHLSEFISFAL